MPDIYHGKIHMNSALAGWSEGHYLAASSLDEARSRMEQYVSLRSAALASSCQIVWGTVSTIEEIAGPEIRRRANSLPIGFLPLEGASKYQGQDNVVNIAADCMSVRFVSAHQGRFGTKALRGLPDGAVRREKFWDLVTGLRIKKADVDAPPVPPLFPDVFQEVISNLLKWLVFHTRHAYEATPGNKATLTLAEWNEAIVIRPSQRNVGRPFGPFRGRRRS